ncbi:MAG TPA: glucoamylase family protein [Bacteroidales bacterium]|nr:glucoamylase family protein [Bacteroidales bacterium]
MRLSCAILVVFALSLSGCSKPDNPGTQVPVSFGLFSLKVNNKLANTLIRGAGTLPEIKVTFTASLDKNTTQGALSLVNSNNSSVSCDLSYSNHDSTLIIKPSAPLDYISEYGFSVSRSLKSASGGSLISSVSLNIYTAIDSSSKFPAVTDDSLLTLVQKQTFRYFWDFGHPVSGMARERNTSGETVTTGGTGFGIMAIPVAIERHFITRQEGLDRLIKITGFLTNKAGHYHGAFSHWMNGTDGTVVPFGVNDDGADIVETSYMMMGLLTARQYFSGPGSDETSLRNSIDSLWYHVEWDWYRKNGEEMLYWNWSPVHGWAVNVPVRGWNECLITYVLAASSPTHPVPKSTYDNGFAFNGGIMNNNSYYGIVLPLGQPFGGPLFFEQYSFLGIDPRNLSDNYANYHTQTVNHSKINYEYCVNNPKSYYGYSSLCWGLTASDIKGGYTASSPTNDVGVIAPTAAISSLPFTPSESLSALKFFYYQLGDKIWGDYGFRDAFSLHDPWFADSFLAIDQGPQIGMIENYRSGLLWNLFMSCPEISSGLTKLGFSY